MTFAEIARELPQFGRSLHNVARTRTEVFAANRGRRTGAGPVSCSEAASCECGDAERGQRGQGGGGDGRCSCPPISPSAQRKAVCRTRSRGDQQMSRPAQVVDDGPIGWNRSDYQGDQPYPPWAPMGCPCLAEYLSCVECLYSAWHAYQFHRDCGVANRAIDGCASGSCHGYEACVRTASLVLGGRMPYCPPIDYGRCDPAPQHVPANDEMKCGADVTEIVLDALNQMSMEAVGFSRGSAAISHGWTMNRDNDWNLKDPATQRRLGLKQASTPHGPRSVAS